MDIKQQPVSWFMIPVADMVRAVSFYNHVFNLDLAATAYQEWPLAHFHAADGQPGGALVFSPERAGKCGVVVYMNGGEDLNPCLERAREVGVAILIPRTDIGQGLGFYAHIEDSESNEIGIYSTG